MASTQTGTCLMVNIFWLFMDIHLDIAMKGTHQNHPYKACCLQDCAVFLYDFVINGRFLFPTVQMMAVCFVLVLGSFSPCLSPLSLLADTSSLSSSSASSHPSSSPPLPSADRYTTSQGRSIGR